MRRTPDDYWASFFGLSVAEFLKPGLKVVPHVGLSGYEGAWLFKQDSSSIISVPSGLVAEIKGKVSDAITDEKFIALFGERVTKVIGPAYKGSLEEADFRPLRSSARLLSSKDEECLEELRAHCDEQEWEHSDIHVGEHPTFGLFVDGHLVAVSNYSLESEGVAAPGILTHPDHRGRGYGKAVLSAATEHALSQKFLLLYQTLLLNKPALAAAQSLGYKQYGTHLAVRLRE